MPLPRAAAAPSRVPVSYAVASREAFRQRGPGSRLVTNLCEAATRCARLWGAARTSSGNRVGVWPPPRMVNARGCLPALFWRCEEPRSPSARAQFLNKKPRTVASGIGWRDDAGPFAAIDQHHRRAALRHGRCAASPGRSICPGGVSHLRGAELAIAVRILPTLPAGAAELAREIEALDVIGIAGPGAAVMVRDQRRQRHRRALSRHRAIMERRDMPPCVGCTEPDGARLLAADSQIAEACNRLALQWSFAVGLGDNQRVRRLIERYGAAAFPDKHLKPGAAIFRRGKRNAAGRQHRDIAAR